MTDALKDSGILKGKSDIWTPCFIYICEDIRGDVKPTSLSSVPGHADPGGEVGAGAVLGQALPAFRVKQLIIENVFEHTHDVTCYKFLHVTSIERGRLGSWPCSAPHRPCCFWKSTHLFTYPTKSQDQTLLGLMYGLNDVTSVR